jgi:hypothetical protein
MLTYANVYVSAGDSRRAVYYPLPAYVRYTSATYVSIVDTSAYVSIVDGPSTMLTYADVC